MSIAAQEFSVQGRTQLQPQTSDQSVHIGFPEGTAFSSSWRLLTGNLERLLQIRWFASNGMRSNYNSANRNDEGSSEAKRIAAEQTQARLEQSTLSGVDVNRAYLPLRSQPREVSAKSQGYRQPNNQDLNQENTLSRHQAIQLKLPKFRQLTSLPNKTYCDAAVVKSADCGSDSQGNLCSERYVHIAMTLDVNYLRGSMAVSLTTFSSFACFKWVHQLKVVPSLCVSDVSPTLDCLDLFGVSLSGSIWPGFWSPQYLSPCLDEFCFRQLSVQNIIKFAYVTESVSILYIILVYSLNYCMQAIYSILLHAACPSNIRFHFVATDGKVSLIYSAVLVFCPRTGEYVVPAQIWWISGPLSFELLTFAWPLACRRSWRRWWPMHFPSCSFRHTPLMRSQWSIEFHMQWGMRWRYEFSISLSG